MDEEMRALERNQNLEGVERKGWNKLVGCEWVYTTSHTQSRQDLWSMQCQSSGKMMHSYI